MNSMFENNKSFNQNIKKWDVEKVKKANKHTDFAKDGVLIDEYNPFVEKKKYKPTTKDELQNYCDDLSISLGDIDTSLITDMSGLFFVTSRTNWDGIESWDVSNVTTMNTMFHSCGNFNHPLNNWNVSKVTDMSGMFIDCEKFNQPLDKWDVSNVTTMRKIFENATSFYQNISMWDVKMVKNYHPFANNCPINNTDKMPKFKN